MTKKLNIRKIHDFDYDELQGVRGGITCHRFFGHEWNETSITAPVEMDLGLHVNKKELVNILCTPSKLKCLIYGFLYGQGIILGIDDIDSIHHNQEKGIIEIRLNDGEFEFPTHLTLTSGCGGSVFETEGRKVTSNLVVKPLQVLELLKDFQERMELYPVSGGVHTSALADSRDLLITAEDIGRHNTLDKIFGECLLREISTKDLLLITTGRISSEMLLKAARMQVPIIVSRHSPTAKAISMAGDLGITLVGRARQGLLVVYTYPERLGWSGMLRPA